MAKYLSTLTTHGIPFAIGVGLVGIVWKRKLVGLKTIEQKLLDGNKIEKKLLFVKKDGPDITETAWLLNIRHHVMDKEEMGIKQKTLRTPSLIRAPLRTADEDYLHFLSVKLPENITQTVTVNLPQLRKHPHFKELLKSMELSVAPKPPLASPDVVVLTPRSMRQPPAMSSLLEKASKLIELDSAMPDGKDMTGKGKKTVMKSNDNYDEKAKWMFYKIPK